MSDSNQNINPEFKKGYIPSYTMDQCISGVKNKDYKILAHLISKSESHLKADRLFVSDLISKLPVQGYSRRIAVSGAPGVGKSTFINSIGKILTEEGHSIAVLPVDPSSHISKGSILGDKTRMEDIAPLPSVFIKPMSSSLVSGGVAPATSYASILCEKAGFDYVIIETVGVGQSEYSVKDIVDCFILLLQPGGGDDLQGIKRGIMEMADILVINKADGDLIDNARISHSAYKSSLKLLLPNALGWKAEIALYSSINGSGAEHLFSLIDNYFHFIRQGNIYTKLRQSQSIKLFDRQSKEIIMQHFMSLEGIKELITELRHSIQSGSIPAIEALHRLEGIFNEK